MDTTNFDRFKQTIANLTQPELKGEGRVFEKLTLEQDGKIQICYAPFEYVNTQAKVVIVGITPGKTQMLNALSVAKEQILLGKSQEEAVKAAKQFGAFSGKMRPLLTQLLDHCRINEYLGIGSCESLFDPNGHAHLVHSTSILRNPVFVDGENYAGSSPKMLSNPLLRSQIIKDFAKDAEQLQDAVFIPLGDKVAEALFYLADKCVIKRSRIMDGMPHASPANIERIKYFLGMKNKEDLSIKTNPHKIDSDKAALFGKIANL